MKRLFKFKILATFGIFILTFLTHFGYDLIKCDLTAIFFPVNESIFEHMKMLFTTFIIYSVIEYFIFKRKDVSVNNFIFSYLITGVMVIGIFLILFLPFYYRYGENMTYTIIMEFVAIALSQLISYYILSQKPLKLEKISIVLIIIIFIVLGYLTYNPIICDFFFDPTNEKYGINVYNI